MVTTAALTGLTVLSLTLAPVGPAPVRWRATPLTVDALPELVYVAHRGGAREVPENSMAGLVTARARGTAQVLDVDTRELADGTLVAMHDATLDRTTYTAGRVGELTSAGWNAVRLRTGPELPTGFRPQRPPTVAAVLDRFGGRAVLILEAKDPHGLHRLAGLIKERGLTRSVLVNSNRPEVARRAHRLGLIAQLWRSARQMRSDRPERWRGFVRVLDVDHRARDKDLLRAVRSGVPHVWAHTVNTPRRRDRALRLGCDGIITDAPGLLDRVPEGASGRHAAGGNSAGGAPAPR
ncbi:glycerophosphodiester phosphodiesterase [Streptomyces tsukubensis]|uniref:Glycerophosphodiester phosphodiesterase n=1 Tax=Streptomyces tsukubensis TaxID=83656 RepID=A0A1V3ZZU8_9ACTN|nr:glycerophosphodiester phosphodiesterase family protein [Streptomyces tsukubensis]OON72058.1 glycerophosphodiester phosphodiesterase [Streptomyces tsukubensis]QFR93275.1 glycerophosphodiester phosphodiesterase [Streptomyces tsukubensis]